jgi:hypothetical protein
MDKKEVVEIQQRLNDLGFPKLLTDGVWGKKTKNNVRLFQKHKGLSPDGIVGPLTKAALFDVTEKPPVIVDIDSLASDSLDFDGDNKVDLNKKGIQLILDFEVGGGKQYYEKLLQRPTWPGYQSGVTIGVGYDLGYNTRASFDKDFSDLPQSIRTRLYPCLGVKGSAAKNFISDLKDIKISWDLAYDVYKRKTLPSWYLKTRNAFGNIDSFHANVKSALVSLVFNRGTLINSTNRRIEMKRIRDIHIPKKDYAAIAQEFRNMKRHWAGTSVGKGLIRRREAEAKLIEEAI